jgi:uncharacterized membrane protein YbhN (UPF0104 family)
LSLHTIKSESRKVFHIRFLLRFIGATFALIFIIYLVDLEKISKALTKADISLILLAILIAVASPLLTSCRLKLFVLATGTPISYSRCFFANLCGLSLNLFLPARGGDLVKMVYLRKNGEPAWGNLAGVVLWERAFDVLALGLLGFAASIILGIHKAAIATGIVIIIISIIFFNIPKITTLPIIGKKAKNFSSIIVKARKRKLYQLGCICMCCLCWTTNITIMGLLFNALEDSFSLQLAFAVTPPSIFTGMVPVSLWGIGTRDGALAYFMQGITSPEIAISAGCLYTALVYWLLGLIGTPFLLFAKMKNQ